MRVHPVLALSLSLLASAAPPPHTNATRTTTYHSDAMHFDFTYPATFTSNSRKSADTRCVSTPIAVMDIRTSFNMIFLKSYDISCLSKDLLEAGPGSAAAKVLKDMLAAFGQPNMNSASSYNVAGHNAAVDTGFAKAAQARGPNTIYGAASCTVTSNNLACFEFLSNDCSNLNTLAASPIRFADHSAVPLIPRKLSYPCAP